MLVVVLAAAVVGAVLVALGIGRREASFRETGSFLRKPWLLALALLPQIVWTRWLSSSGAGAAPLSWLVALSYVPLVAFLLLNWRRRWLYLIFLGVGLNLAAMVANGGAMPAPARLASVEASTVAASTDRLAPGTKDRVIGDATPIYLAILADRFVIPLPGGGARLASVGDFLIVGGGLLGLLVAVGASAAVSPNATSEVKNAA